MRANATAPWTGGEGCGDTQQGRRGSRALYQDVIGRLDQMPHLGGAVVSCDLLTLVAEKVLADRAPRLRATEAPFTKGRLGSF